MCHHCSRYQGDTDDSSKIKAGVHFLVSGEIRYVLINQLRIMINFMMFTEV